MFKKLFYALILTTSILSAEEIFQVDNFEVSLFSKLSKEAVQIETSIIFEGRDVEVYDFKIIDALNVVISSFFAENLLTSQGKEGLKEALIKYTRDKYSIDIDHIYIQKLNIVKNVTATMIIDELRKEGYIKK
jgi:hypothetical protein